MSLTSIDSSAPFIPAPLTIRKIDSGDLDWALAAGWRDFMQKRGDIIILALIYPLGGFAAAALSFNDELLPLFFPLVAGLSILGPAVATGFYELARRREVGLDAGWRNFFAPITGPNRFGIAVLTLGLAVIFAAWLLAASLIAKETVGSVAGIDAAAFLQRVITTPQGWFMILIGNLAGLVFAILTLVFAMVSFPLSVDKVISPFTAVATSIEAVRANPKTIALWGLRVVALLILGSIPAFVGLAVVLPVLGYASWHLYTRLVVR